LTDIETHLKNMAVVFQKDVFKILSVLVKHRDEPISFTWLKAKTSLNPNLLSKHLKKLMELRLVDNYYEKVRDGKHYSFYRLTENGLNILQMQVDFPRVWELLGQFKEHCKSKGWKTSEDEDWIQADGKYHLFLWCRTINPSTFTKIATTHKTVIFEKERPQIVDVAYTAWLITEIMPNELAQIVVKERPMLAETIAIYDLSQANLAKPGVSKLNKTNSEVFREFEHFLRTHWRLKFMDMRPKLEIKQQVRMPKHKRA